MKVPLSSDVGNWVDCRMPQCDRKRGAGSDPRGVGRGERSPPPPRRLLATKSIKSRSYESQMHQNSLFELKNRKLLGRGHIHLPRPSFIERGTLPFHTHPTFSALILAPTALDSTCALGAQPWCLRRLGPRRIHSPPSHTLWIRPWRGDHVQVGGLLTYSMMDEQNE